jgi:hypothetical protein
MTEVFSDLIEYIDYFIDAIAFQKKDHYRVIVDEDIPFPNYVLCVKGDNFIEFSTKRWNENNRMGWNKPHHLIGEDIEVRYLWTQFSPCSLKNLK